MVRPGGHDGGEGRGNYGKKKENRKWHDTPICLHAKECKKNGADERGARETRAQTGGNKHMWLNCREGHQCEIKTGFRLTGAIVQELLRPLVLPKLAPSLCEYAAEERNAGSQESQHADCGRNQRQDSPKHMAKKQRHQKLSTFHQLEEQFWVQLSPLCVAKAQHC